MRGRVGRALIAIRDQPIAAETMGVNAALYKTTCFGVSALYAGVAGGLSAIAVGFVSPDSFGLPLSLAFLVGIVVGGLASLGGVLFGALFIEFVPNHRRPALGQFRRERQGAAGRDLRRAADSGNGGDADGSSGRGAGGGDASCARSLRLDEARVGNERRRERRRASDGGKGRIAMITRRTFLQSSAAAAAFAASAGSARADNAPGVTDTEIKIGQTMPYSGPASAYGVIGKSRRRLFQDDQRAGRRSTAARSI